MIYQPKEDSYLLKQEIENYLKTLDKKQKNNLKVLDMGSGLGIQAKACIKEGIKKQNILAVDIDTEVISNLKKLKIPSKHSNLFNNINKKQKYDLIIFNPPYLPEDKQGYDNLPDTTAGKKGNEIILLFLKQAKHYLTKQGKILLLFSNLSKPRTIISYAKKLKYNYKKLNEKNMGFFEKLYVYEFYLKN